ncbi:hypothetical protein [Mesorhizobium sp. ESP7-2]|uniref:hypothetical protein n=1 Tax=Mesorhizobium sp. ESP7-2 TaxID=2876622 RepID=UPI00398C7E04
MDAETGRVCPYVVRAAHVRAIAFYLPLMKHLAARRMPGPNILRQRRDPSRAPGVPKSFETDPLAILFNPFGASFIFDSQPPRAPLRLPRQRRHDQRRDG